MALYLFQCICGHKEDKEVPMDDIRGKTFICDVCGGTMTRRFTPIRFKMRQIALERAGV